MNMERFELFMGELGNGLTVCNSAVTEHGDYKQIAHISNGGKIKWYVPVTSIPGPALLRVEHTADAMHQNARQAVERGLATDKARTYYRMLNDLPTPAFLSFMRDTKSADDETKIAMLTDLYLEYA